MIILNILYLKLNNYEERNVIRNLDITSFLMNESLKSVSLKYAIICKVCETHEGWLNDLTGLVLMFNAVSQRRHCTLGE